MDLRFLLTQIVMLGFFTDYNNGDKYQVKFFLFCTFHKGVYKKSKKRSAVQKTQKITKIIGKIHFNEPNSYALILKLITVQGV